MNFQWPVEPTWFLVATKPRAEAQAQLHLERQAYRVCAPKIEVKRRRRGVWQQVVEPLFPGYVFVQVVLGEQDIAPIRSTVGCLSIVHFGGCPSKVPDAVMRPFLALGDAPFLVDRENLAKRRRGALRKRALCGPRSGVLDERGGRSRRCADDDAGGAKVYCR